MTLSACINGSYQTVQTARRPLWWHPDGHTLADCIDGAHGKLPTGRRPLWSHLQRRASRRVPTAYVVKLPGSSWRRVYCLIHDGTVTCAVDGGRGWIRITD